MATSPSSERTIALILYYSDFYIPKGARLYLYNAAKTQVLGAYTHRTHPKNGPFATQAVAGDEVILEYVPAPSGETPRLRIREVGYGIIILKRSCQKYRKRREPTFQELAK